MADQRSALEGADLLLVYHPNEQKDAEDTKAVIKDKAPSVKVELLAVDLSTEKNCMQVVEKAKQHFDGRVDILYVIRRPELTPGSIMRLLSRKLSILRTSRASSGATFSTSTCKPPVVINTHLAVMLSST
jgi:hypothetical protein